MTVAVPTTDALSRTVSVPGVEAFSTGFYQGKTYDHADIDDMVRNFKDHGHLVRPPVVIGHDEDREFMKNTGYPKAGTVAAVHRWDVRCRLCDGSGMAPAAMKEGAGPGGACPTCLGTKIQGLFITDLAEVPRGIARLIKTRAYDRASAEVYHKPAEGVPGTGKSLRRLSLMGGQLPHVKTLYPLPKEFEGFGEVDPGETFERVGPDVVIVLREVRELPDGAFECFSEVTKMADATGHAHKPAGTSEGGQFAAAVKEAAGKARKVSGKDHETVKASDAAGKSSAAAETAGTPEAHEAAALEHHKATKSHEAYGDKMGNVDRVEGAREHAVVHYGAAKAHDKAGDYHLARAHELRTGKKPDWYVAKHAEAAPMADKTDTKADAYMDDDAYKKMDPKEGCKKFGEYCQKKMSEYHERGKKLFGSAFSLYTQGLTKMSETELQAAIGTAVTKALADRNGAVQFSEAETRKQLQPIIDAAVATAVAEVKAQMGPIQRDVDTFKESTRRESLAKFVETQWEAGKVSSAERDETAKAKNPRHRTILDRLLACDAKVVVHKFAENGREVELTQLDIEKAAIEARTPFHFGEKFKQGPPGDGNGDQELQKVELAYDQFSERYEAMGFPKKDLVEAFTIKRKWDPKITAERFLTEASGKVA